MADEQSIAAFVREVFGDKSFYEILGVETTADENALKKAYRKLALVYHPDRSGGDTEKFKALSIVHSILSDTTKRAIYDSTGEVETNDTSEDFANFYDYFRTLFPKLTVTKIEEFSKTYQGSTEEKEDLTEAYIRYKGDMKKVMEVVMFAEAGEELRLCETIDALISEGILTSTKAYQSFKNKLVTASGKPKKAKTKSKGKDNNMEDLAAAIIAKNKSNAGGFGALFAKYGGGEEEDNDISDDAFENTRKRLLDERNSSSSSSSSSRKEGGRGPKAAKS